MSKANATSSRRVHDKARNLSAVQIRLDGETEIEEVTRRIRWTNFPRRRKSIGELSFTARTETGVLDRWAVTPPNTDYCAVHRMLGKAYAYEFLDLVHDPHAEVSPGDLGFTVGAMLRKFREAGGWRDAEIIEGFFDAIGEYLVTGSVNR